MKWLLTLLLSTSLTCSEPSIRVLISQFNESIALQAKGPVELFDPETGQLVTSDKKRKGTLKTTSSGLTWGRKKIDGHYTLRLVSDSPILINKTPYLGSIEIYSIGGRLNVVNEVGVDDYIESTLTTFPAKGYSDTTLDALCITARTNAHFLSKRSPYSTWQVKAESVGYSGLPPATSIHDAVTRTKGIYLTKNKEAFPTAFSVNHAGKSASYSSIFRKPSAAPEGRSMLASHRTRKLSTWHAKISFKELAKASGLDDIIKVDFFRDKISKKVYAVRLQGTSGTIDLDFFTLQHKLSPRVLKSNDFTAEMRGDRLFIKGHGIGSGVGLCLQSAEELSRQGVGVESILRHHFPATSLHRPK